MIWFRLLYGLAKASSFPDLHDDQFERADISMNWERLDSMPVPFLATPITQQVEQLDTLLQSTLAAYTQHGERALDADPLYLGVSKLTFNSEFLHPNTAISLTVFRWSFYAMHAQILRTDLGLGVSRLFDRSLFLLRQWCRDTSFYLQILGIGLFEPAKLFEQKLADGIPIKDALLALRDNLNSLKQHFSQTITAVEVRRRMHLHASLLTRMARLCYIAGLANGFKESAPSAAPVWRFAHDLAERTILNNSKRLTVGIKHLPVHANSLLSTIEHLLFLGSLPAETSILAASLYALRGQIPLAAMNPVAVMQCNLLISNFGQKIATLEAESAAKGDKLIVQQQKAEQRKKQRRTKTPQKEKRNLVEAEAQLERHVIEDDENVQEMSLDSPSPQLPGLPAWNELTPALQTTMLVILAQYFREKHLLPLADVHEATIDDSFDWSVFVASVAPNDDRLQRMALLVQERNWRVHQPNSLGIPPASSSLTPLDRAIKKLLLPNSVANDPRLLVDRYGSISKRLAEHTLQVIWLAKHCESSVSTDCKEIRKYRNGYLHPHLARHYKFIPEYVKIIDPTFPQ